MELPPGEMMFDALGSDHSHYVPPEAHWRSMALEPEDLVAAAQRIAGVDLSMPAANRRVRPPAPLMSRLSHLHAAATGLAATAPDLLTQPQVARVFEEELVLTMVGCLTAVVAPKVQRRSGAPMHLCSGVDTAAG